MRHLDYICSPKMCGVKVLSEEIVKEVIQNFESNLKEQDRDAFQKFMKIYEQEPEKLRAGK